MRIEYHINICKDVCCLKIRKLPVVVVWFSSLGRNAADFSAEKSAKRENQGKNERKAIKPCGEVTQKIEENAGGTN